MVLFCAVCIYCRWKGEGLVPPCWQWAPLEPLHEAGVCWLRGLSTTAQVGPSCSLYVISFGNSEIPAKPALFWILWFFCVLPCWRLPPWVLTCQCSDSTSMGGSAVVSWVRQWFYCNKFCSAQLTALQNPIGLSFLPILQSTQIVELDSDLLFDLQFWPFLHSSVAS